MSNMRPTLGKDNDDWNEPATQSQPLRGQLPNDPIIIHDEGESSDEEDSDDFEPNTTTRQPTTIRPVQTRHRPQDVLFPLLPPIRHQAAPASWPHKIVHLRANYNPQGIQFPFVDHFGMCDCMTRCRYPSCMNASLGLYCARNNCPYRGKCGNGLQESRSLQLMKHHVTNTYFLRAKRPIERGIIIGEYLGLVTADRPGIPVVPNRGFRLAMRHASREQRRRVCIDAAMFGSMMRFSNHSCDATARFYEVSNTRHHTIVAVTVRDILQGEEVTVDYGPDLWFNCTCGRPTCRHHQ